MVQTLTVTNPRFSKSIWYKKKKKTTTLLFLERSGKVIAVGQWEVKYGQ